MQQGGLKQELTVFSRQIELPGNFRGEYCDPPAMSNGTVFSMTQRDSGQAVGHSNSGFLSFSCLFRLIVSPPGSLSGVEPFPGTAKMKNVMAKQKKKREPLPPVTVWGHVVALAWLVPGGGHFFLKRHGRGAIIAATVTVTFILGLLMRGTMFSPQTGDLLTMVIHVGGFIGDLASGMLYLLASWLGYAQPDAAGHVHDYGTKFLVAAGLMNVLAMMDAFEIAVGRKS